MNTRAKSKKQHKPQRRIHVVRKLAAWLDLPEEAAAPLGRVTLIGSDTALVEDYLGVLRYGDSFVSLDTRSGLLTIAGKGLCLRELSKDRLMVSGSIRSLVFEEGLC